MSGSTNSSVELRCSQRAAYPPETNFNKERETKKRIDS